MSQPFTVPFRSAKVVIVPSLSKASPFLTGPVWPLSVASTAWLAASLVASGNSNAVRSIFTTLKSSERGGSMLRQCYQWTFTPRKLLGVGRDWKNGWMFAVCLHIPWGGHRRTTSSASDASGEAGSEQGWSVVGPPGKHASKISSLETWEETR